jgi:hypothetical protein
MIERQGQNLIAGSSIAILMADNPGLDAVDYTISLVKPRTPVAGWYGWMPLIAADGPTVRVPYAHDGTSVTLTPTRAYAWIENTYTTDLTFRIASSPGGNIFTPTTICDLTIGTGFYDKQLTAGFTGTFSSGQMLRLSFRQACPRRQFLVQMVFSIS